MDTINNVIEFNNRKEEMEKKTRKEMGEQFQITETSTHEDMISYPTEKEIRVMNALLEKYTSADPDAMVPFNMWNGDCMHSIFDEMSEYAKEIDVDPWDAFALFIQKLHGWQMEETEDGVVVRYGKE